MRARLALPPRVGRCAALLLLWVGSGGSVMAETAVPEARRSALPPYSATCIEQARALLRLASSDGVRAAPIPRVSDDLEAELRKSGIGRGELGSTSWISPPSSQSLVQLRSTGAAAQDDPCPLHETYLAVRDGGFAPQPVRYYGPIQPAVR